MNLVMQQGYPDRVGRKYIFNGQGVGPSSYLRSTGDVLNLGQFNNYIDNLDVSQTISGTYYLVARPSSADPRMTWSLHWYVVATNVEVADGVNLSAEKVVVGGYGSNY